MSESEKGNSRASLTLRPVRADDEAFLYELYCSTRREELSAWALEDAQQESFLKLQFKARTRHYEIAFAGADDNIILCDESPIGRVLVFRSAIEIRLVDIELLPEHRGRGIGSSSVRVLCEEARAAGKLVTLHVAKTNRAARLYERLGFSITSDTGADYKMEWRQDS